MHNGDFKVSIYIWKGVNKCVMSIFAINKHPKQLLMNNNNHPFD